MMHSLLDDPLLRVRRTDGSVQGQSLPQILHRLAQDNVVSFAALQSHQQQAWYSFLVQLAAMAVAREAGGAMPSSPAGWRDALVGLAGGDEAAWHWIVEDLSRPAFLQPPVPEGSLDDAGYKADVPTPDQLDMLITSKNHDIKPNRITTYRIEHWIYALLTLQTMEGYLGPGNYGIVRMNGGSSNRPMVGLAKGLTWADRFSRDVDILISYREKIAEDHDYDPNGLPLLWTQPWSGQKDDTINIYDCDPYFLEICRRIRFCKVEGTFRCKRTTTKNYRVYPKSKDINGITGDPWTPVDKSEGKALTLDGAGFTYDRIQEIFLGRNYKRPPALQTHHTDKGRLYLLARTLVRGQGETEGLHYRIVPVPASASGLLQKKSRRERLAQRARDRVERVEEVRRSVLYPAIGTLLGGGDTDAIDFDDVAPWLDAFDRAVDARFFDALWASVDLSDHEAREHWETLLWEEAQHQFDDAEDHAPQSSTRYWRARSSARSIFHGAARDKLKYAFLETAPS
jgi:CRISPR system Cascade subunit CasA